MQNLKGDAIRNAIDRNAYFNERFSKVVIKTLEHHGIIFDDEHYYSLDSVQKLMEKIWGKEISQSTSKLIGGTVRNQR